MIAPNIQAGGVATVGSQYDFEALGFDVAPDNLVDIASMICPNGSLAGPLTLGAATFPSGTFNDGHGTNIRGVYNFPLTIMRFQDPNDLADLYVAVVAAGAGTVYPDAGSNWTLVQGAWSELFHVYTYAPSAPPPPTRSCTGGCGEDPPLGPCGNQDDVVTNICKRAGLLDCQIDTSLLTAQNVSPTNVVKGFTVERPTTAADVLKSLMLAFFFDGAEINGTMKFVPRGLPAMLTIPEDDLGLVADKGKLEESWEQEQDLPQRFTVTYKDPLYLYQQGKQQKIRSTRLTSTKQQQAINIPMVMDADWAHDVAERALFLSWLERQPFAINLGRQSYLLLDATDVIEFSYEGLTFTARIKENAIGRSLSIELKTVNENSQNYLTSGAPGAVQPAIEGSIGPGAGGSKTPQVIGPTSLFLFDIPLLQDADANPGATGKYVALGSPQAGAWPGAALFISSDDADYQQEGDPSTIDPTYGDAVNVLGIPSSPFSIDTVNTLTVRLSNGAFASDSDQNIFNGSNMMIVGSEIIQFGVAVNNGDGTWTLSRLLRGRRGTEWACGYWGDFKNGQNTHQAGELCVLVSGPGSPIGSLGLFRVADNLSLLNLLRYYRGVTLGADVTTVSSQQFTIAGNDLKPYAPVKVAGSFKGNGNLPITWQRRTRVGGDGWGEGSNAGTLPLSEDSEAYEVEILDAAGVNVVRTITGISSPTVVYTKKQQTADFGTPLATYNVNVYQISAQVGRGFKGHGNVPAGNSVTPPLPPTPPAPTAEDLVIGFVMNDGSTGNNVGPELKAPRAGVVQECSVIVKASDPAVDLTFRIKQYPNGSATGVDVFATDPTIAHSTAEGTLFTFPLSSSPLAIAADDVFKIDVTNGSSSWEFTAQLD